MVDFFCVFGLCYYGGFNWGGEFMGKFVCSWELMKVSVGVLWLDKLLLVFLLLLGICSLVVMVSFLILVVVMMIEGEWLGVYY